jgi:hypothetical protein
MPAPQTLYIAIVFRQLFLNLAQCLKGIPVNETYVDSYKSKKANRQRLAFLLYMDLPAQEAGCPGPFRLA